MAILAAVMTLSSLGCKNKKLTAESAITTKEKTPSKFKKLSAETKAWLEGKTIAIVLGYGYSDEESIARITQDMDSKFGVSTEENPALISIFVYPNDFMSAGKARVSSLVNLVEDKNLAGLIVVGAPEGMHIALSKLQDKADAAEARYPVFNFFPQDDILGSESTSDFVLDYAHKTNNLETEVTDTIPDFDLETLLTSSVIAISNLREPLKADKTLADFVKKLFNSKKTITHYIDGETGLQSINHFIFE